MGAFSGFLFSKFLYTWVISVSVNDLWHQYASTDEYWTFVLGNFRSRERKFLWAKVSVTVRTNGQLENILVVLLNRAGTRKISQIDPCVEGAEKNIFGKKFLIRSRSAVRSHPEHCRRLQAACWSWNSHGSQSAGRWVHTTSRCFSAKQLATMHDV